MGARSVGNDCLWEVTNILKITLGVRRKNCKYKAIYIGCKVNEIKWRSLVRRYSDEYRKKI